MKIYFKLFLFILIIYSCSDKKSNQNILTENKKEINIVSEFQSIKDTTKFISNLKNIYNIKVDEEMIGREQITFFEKVNIYGSEKEYFFIEYDFEKGCMASFPWKIQLFLTKNGDLLKKFYAKRFEFVEIFEHKNPFLLILDVSGKGNGGHEIYKISAGHLENIYEGYYNYDVQTYDASHWREIFQPYELNIKFIDYNKDGYKDLVFFGNKIMLMKRTKEGVFYDVEKINGKIVNNSYSIDNPADIIPIEYVYLYNNETGHFVEKEDNSEKYSYEK